MAKKLAWLYGKRGFVLLAAALAAVLGAKAGVHPGASFGFFDGS